jgi:hypothetical protein
LWFSFYPKMTTLKLSCNILLQQLQPKSVDDATPANGLRGLVS